MKNLNRLKSSWAFSPITVRRATFRDISGILALKSRLTGLSLPWGERELFSQISFFPEGQFVAETTRDKKIVGTLGTLVIFRLDYSLLAKWRDLTANGTFRNHDREHGKTLFRSHLVIDPAFDGTPVMRDLLCQNELKIAEQLGMERIRTGLRFKDYYLFHHLGPGEYFRQVEQGIIGDSWINQTLDRGFKALALVGQYYPQDWRSDGNAVIAQLDLHSRESRRADPIPIISTSRPRIVA